MPLWTRKPSDGPESGERVAPARTRFFPMGLAPHGCGPEAMAIEGLSQGRARSAPDSPGCATVSRKK